MRIRHSTYGAVFLAVGVLMGDPAGASVEPTDPPVLVLLQNDAAVPADVAASAQAEVVRLYKLIGVQVAWVTKVPEFGRRLRVVSLVTWEPAEGTTSASALGLTYGDHRIRATRAYVFWRRVERASQKFTALLPNLLAAAIAHELGHMLLPDGSHANHGLMEASWNSEHFRSASAGFLHFSPETAALIRRGVDARR